MIALPVAVPQHECEGRVPFIVIEFQQSLAYLALGESLSRPKSTQQRREQQGVMARFSVSDLMLRGGKYVLHGDGEQGQGAGRIQPRAARTDESEIRRMRSRGDRPLRPRSIIDLVEVGLEYFSQAQRVDV